MTPISHTPPAQTPELQATILGNLPEPLLLQMMALKSQEKDLGWLRTMVDGGLLDTAESLINITDKPSMTKLCDKWSARADAMTAFMTTLTYDVIEADTLLGDLESPVKVARFEATQEFKDFFETAAARMAAGYEALTAHPEHGNWARFTSMGNMAINKCSAAGVSVGRWMAAACVLDLPGVIQKLRKLCPTAHAATIPFSALGAEMESQALLKKEFPLTAGAPDLLQVTPYFVALQLSRIECMDALVDHGAYGFPRMGSSGRGRLTTLIDAQSLTQVMIPACQPHALTHALKPFLSRLSLEEKNETLVQALMVMDLPQARLRPFVAAFLAAGVYDMDPCRSVLKAVEQGFPQVVRDLKGPLPWEAMTQGSQIFSGRSSPIYCSAIKSELGKHSALHEKAIIEFIDRAVHDGQADLVLPTFVHATLSAAIFEPVTTLVQKNFAKALVKYLDHGFDPQSRANPAGPTLVEQAENHSPAMGQLIRAHQARKKSREMLSEIESPSTVNQHSLP